jgi:hypothetical protein
MKQPETVTIKHMTATFKQIRDDKDISEREGFGTTVIYTVLTLSLGVSMILTFDVNPITAGLTMLAIAWIGRRLLRKHLGDFAKKSDIIGTLTFDTTSISWTLDKSTQISRCADIASLNLEYNYIQGRQFAYKDIIHNGLALLTIDTKSNQKLIVKFLIETEEQLKTFIPIWKEYYRQGIRIRESMGKYDVKTILFEKATLSYTRIQELKKELNVDSFY